MVEINNYSIGGVTARNVKFDPGGLLYLIKGSVTTENLSNLTINGKLLKDLTPQDIKSFIESDKCQIGGKKLNAHQLYTLLVQLAVTKRNERQDLKGEITLENILNNITTQENTNGSLINIGSTLVSDALNKAYLKPSAKQDVTGITLQSATNSQKITISGTNLTAQNVKSITIGGTKVKLDNASWKENGVIVDHPTGLQLEKGGNVEVVIEPQTGEKITKQVSITIPESAATPAPRVAAKAAVPTLGGKTAEITATKEIKISLGITAELKPQDVKITLTPKPADGSKATPIVVSGKVDASGVITINTDEAQKIHAGQYGVSIAMKGAADKDITVDGNITIPEPSADAQVEQVGPKPTSTIIGAINGEKIEFDIKENIPQIESTVTGDIQIAYSDKEGKNQIISGTISNGIITIPKTDAKKLDDATFSGQAVKISYSQNSEKKEISVSDIRFAVPVSEVASPPPAPAPAAVTVNRADNGDLVLTVPPRPEGATTATVIFNPGDGSAGIPVNYGDVKLNPDGTLTIPKNKIPANIKEGTYGVRIVYLDDKKTDKKGAVAVQNVVIPSAKGAAAPTSVPSTTGPRLETTKNNDGKSITLGMSNNKIRTILTFGLAGKLKPDERQKIVDGRLAGLSGITGQAGKFEARLVKGAGYAIYFVPTDKPQDSKMILTCTNVSIDGGKTQATPKQIEAALNKSIGATTAAGPAAKTTSINSGSGVVTKDTLTFKLSNLPSTVTPPAKVNVIINETGYVGTLAKDGTVTIKLSENNKAVSSLPAVGTYKKITIGVMNDANDGVKEQIVENGELTIARPAAPKPTPKLKTQAEQADDLIKGIKGNPNSKAVKENMDKLGQAAKKYGFDKLMADLNGKDTKVQERAIWMLFAYPFKADEKTQYKKAFAGIKGQLNNLDPNVRYAAVSVFAFIGGKDKDVIHDIRVKSTNDKEKPEVRNRAIIALGLLDPNQDTLKAVAALLSSKDPCERGDAASVLGSKGDKSYIPALRQQLAKEANPSVKDSINAAIKKLQSQK